MVGTSPDKEKEASMDVTSRKIANALKTAIRREERTAAAYTDKAAGIQDPAAKAVLESLAKQEVSHGKKLRMVLDKQMNLSRLGKGGSKVVGTLRVVNDDLLKMERASEAVKVLQKALVSEQNSCKLYRSLEKIYNGLELAELFGKLAQEEEKHAARIEKTLAKMV